MEEIHALPHTSHHTLIIYVGQDGESLLMKDEN